MNVKSSGTLVVLGMHRSGTSLCSQWLHSCGLPIGKNLMGKGVGNVEGHYEDLDFLHFHEEVFKEKGMHYGGIHACPDMSLSPASLHQLKSLIQSKNEDHSFWGWKDPRTCLFLDYYSELLRNPHYLVMYRPCLVVVESLWNRREKQTSKDRKMSQSSTQEDEKWIENSIDSWIQYNLCILKLLSTLATESYKVSSISDLKSEEGELFSWLEGKGYPLKFKSFSEIYSEKHITPKSLDDGILVEDKLAAIQLIEEGFSQLKAGEALSVDLEKIEVHFKPENLTYRFARLSLIKKWKNSIKKRFFKES